MAPTTLPATDRQTPAADLPIDKAPPEIDPLREAVERVKADCRLAPAEYLDQVRVPVGGE